MLLPMTPWEAIPQEARTGGSVEESGGNWSDSAPERHSQTEPPVATHLRPCPGARLSPNTEEVLGHRVRIVLPWILNTRTIALLSPNPLLPHPARGRQRGPL